MTRRLRVFVSSTMLDLANERAAVVRELEALNVEPVNAEALLPTGDGSWTVLEKEIRSSDVFVLVVGERYGWLPKAGPHAGSNKAVTELEYDAARAAGLPVLPFFRRLAPGRRTRDARRRDDFRKRVSSWEHGHFKADFDLADDLAVLVRQSVVAMLTSRWREHPRPEVTAPPGTPELKRVPLSNTLVSAVRSRDPVLFAGAGMSLQAGMPSAYALTEVLLSRIREHDPQYRWGAHGGSFNEVATDLERLIGTDGLVEVISQAVKVGSEVGPSAGQVAAIDLFDTIVTTNYDTLLEAADPRSRLAVVASETPAALPARALVKLHGTVDDPTGLVVTSTQLREHPTRRRSLIASVQELFSTRAVVVVGSSLRDPTTQALFADRAASVGGWAVAPTFSKVDRLRLDDWNLTAVEASADDFLISLARSQDT